MSKETFKNFVRNYPELSNSVMDDRTSWQKLYELFELYGENSNVWDKYLTPSDSLISTVSSKESSFAELINMIKKVDLDSVQKGVNSLQKTLGLLQDIGIGSKTKESVYEPRPLYKYFDD